MALKILAEVLNQLPVFSKLNPSERSAVSELAVQKSFGSGEMIAMQGEIWPNVFVLASGEIVVQKLSLEGRSLGAWWLSENQTFWSPSLFDDGPLPATLEVRQPSEIHLWHRDWILPIVKKNQSALWDLCTLLTRRMRQASSVLEDLAFQPVNSRVARLLLKQYQETADPHVVRSLTLDEMATITGTTSVMVCKILSRFADQGVIKVSRTEFEFVDHGKLREIAGL